MSMDDPRCIREHCRVERDRLGTASSRRSPSAARDKSERDGFLFIYFLFYFI